MNGSAQDRGDDRQDKERNEGENFPSLHRRDGRPDKEQSDQNDTQNDDGSDCVIGQCLFPSGSPAWMIPSVYRMVAKLSSKKLSMGHLPVEIGSVL